MPQPIHFSKIIETDFTAEIILQHPALAAHIGAIANRWNSIEVRISSFLAALVGGEAEIVVSVFTAITNDGSKRAVLDTVAAQRLSLVDQEKLQAILTTIGKRYQERNRVVHGCWGISPNFPDALLWMDGAVSTEFILSLSKHVPHSPEFQAAWLAIQQKMMVYREADFLDIEERLRAVSTEFDEFSKPYVLKLVGDFATYDPPENRLPPQSQKNPDPTSR